MTSSSCAVSHKTHTNSDTDAHTITVLTFFTNTHTSLNTPAGSGPVVPNVRVGHQITLRGRQMINWRKEDKTVQIENKCFQSQDFNYVTVTNICADVADKMHPPLPCTGGREMDSYKAFVKELLQLGKAIRCHEKSNVHRAAAGITSAANAGVNVANALSAAKQKLMAEARTALLSIFSSVQYLACQGVKLGTAAQLACTRHPRTTVLSRFLTTFSMK